MAVVQSGTPATPATTTSGTGTVIVTGTWGTGQSRTTGNLLVALVTAFGSTSAGLMAQNTGTTGWTAVFQSTNSQCRAEIWTKTATSGDAAPAFTSSIGGTTARTTLSCTLIELTDNVNTGATPALDTGNAGTGTSGTLTVTTAGSVAATGEYAVAVECATSGASGANTWTTSGSWTQSFTDGVTAYSHWVAAVQASPSSGSTLAYAPAHTITSTNEGGAVAVFKPNPPLLQANTAEGGTDQATVTVANSGGTSGNAFTGVDTGSASPAIFDAAHPAKGTLGYKFATTASAVPCYVYWSPAVGVPQAWFRFYLYLAGYPSATTELGKIAATGGGSSGSILRVNTSGNLEFTDNTGTVQITSAAPVPTAQFVRIEGTVIAATTATGTAEFKIWSTTPDGAGAADDTKTAASIVTVGAAGGCKLFVFGNFLGASNQGPSWLDDIAISSTAYLGPSAGSLNTGGLTLKPLTVSQAVKRAALY